MSAKSRHGHEFYVARSGRRILWLFAECWCGCMGREVEYRPIAGRGPEEDEVEDRAREGDLRADEKEVAEQIMLVDCGAEDVGRVSELGSVRVERPDVCGAV